MARKKWKSDFKECKNKFDIILKGILVESCKKTHTDNI